MRDSEDSDLDRPASPLEPDVVPAPPTADIGETMRAVESRGGRSVALTVLAVLAVLYTLYFARDFLLPIVFALLLDFLFSPLVRWLGRWHVRPPLAAGLVVLSLIALLVLGGVQVATPVQGWVDRVPTTLSVARRKLAVLLRPIERVSRTAEQVEHATDVGGGPPNAQVVVRGPSLVSRVFGGTQRFVTGMLEVLVLLYFLLAAGDLFLQKLVKVLPPGSGRRTAVRIARASESSVSTYLLTAAAANIGEGLLVALAMALLGMPNPLLWGALLAVLEFVPYLGAATALVLLSLAALTSFDGIGRALLVPGVFLAINVVWGNFVVPAVMGRRLTLNPVAIFVGLAFWWWIWGIPGAFVAVPLLATLKIVCDHVESLAPFAEFLGQRDPSERRTSVR